MTLELQRYGSHLDVLDWNGCEAFYIAIIISVSGKLRLAAYQE
jgi:hypothetical protein